MFDTLDTLLQKYNTLGKKERSGKRLWQCSRFGNKYVYLRDLRGKLSRYTSATALFLNMISNGTVGRVEEQMRIAGGELQEIRLAVNEITALLTASTHHDGSVLTAYLDDDTAVWREFRRELIRDEFSSSVIEEYKEFIQEYVMELGSRGVLDEQDWDARESQEHTFEP